jgi:hypothetical protein
MFWEKLRLEPYSSKKHVNYFVVYPKNESIENGISHFFKGLSTVYETCQLGVHHPGNIGPYRKGLVPVPLLRKSFFHIYTYIYLYLHLYVYTDSSYQ